MVVFVPLVLKETSSCPEELWFAIKLFDLYPVKFKIHLKEIANLISTLENPLAFKNKTHVVTLLKETSYTVPRLHSIWPTLLQAQKNPVPGTLSFLDIWALLDGTHCTKPQDPFLILLWSVNALPFWSFKPLYLLFLKNNIHLFLHLSF